MVVQEIDSTVSHVRINALKNTETTEGSTNTLLDKYLLVMLEGLHVLQRRKYTDRKTVLQLHSATKIPHIKLLCSF